MGTHRHLTWTALAVMVALAQWATAQPVIELTALPSTVRVGVTQPLVGTDKAELACARNEVEAFQVVATAEGGRLQGLTVAMSPLKNADGAAIPVENVTVFREAFVPVRYSGRRATLPTGLYPDPLVPLVNPYTGEPLENPKWDGKKLLGGLFGGSRFDVWDGQQHPFWVDVAVPKNAAPGMYSGTFTVSASGAESVAIPVQLEVWDFALPDGPTHENHFGGFERVGTYLGLDHGSDAYLQIEDRFMAMMAEHRINPPLPKRLHPPVGEDGTVTFDDALDAAFTAFVDTHHLTNIDVPRAPFGDILGEGRSKATNYYRAWYAYLEKKGWEKGAYLYMLDEPNDPDAYEKVRQLGALVKEAEPRLRRVVVEQPYTQNPEWGTLDEAIDIWCPLFGFVHEPSVKRVQAAGDEVWSYTALVQTAPPYNPDYEAVKNDEPPFWELDFPVTSYRVSTWLNRRYGITGLLYWSACYWGSPDRNPWYDPGFRVTFNGEGSLFYPGRDAGIDGPVGSIRLKNLREGMEDYEYFSLLEELGGKDVVEETVRTAVPTWGSWDQDPYRLLELRRRLAEEIVKRKG
jgi:Glycoside hydrolase 123, catalytic domain/Glycoside hydrolase 123, N-terminal domain